MPTKAPVIRPKPEITARRWDELGLTQTELASRSGLSQAYISQIESGDRALTVRAAVLLARGLELPADGLLHLADEDIEHLGAYLRSLMNAAA